MATQTLPVLQTIPHHIPAIYDTEILVMKSPAAKGSNCVRISYGLLSATTKIASKADCQTILRFLAPDVGLNFLQIGGAQEAAMMINKFRAWRQANNI